MPEEHHREQQDEHDRRARRTRGRPRSPPPARRRGRRRRSRAASSRGRAAGRRRHSRPRTPGRPSSACGRPRGGAAATTCAGGPPNPVRPMRVHSRATVASGAVAGPGCSGGVSVTGSRRTLAEAPRRKGEEAATRRQARRHAPESVRTSWARKPASATASSASRREHPARPRVAEDAPRRSRASHAERRRREHGRREPPGPRVRRRCRRVAAAHGRPEARCGRACHSSCCGRRSRAVCVLHLRCVRLHDGWHARLRDGRDQRPAVTPGRERRETTRPAWGAA